MQLTSHATTPEEMRRDIVALLDSRIAIVVSYLKITSAVKMRTAWRAREDALLSMRNEVASIIIASKSTEQLSAVFPDEIP